MIARFHTQVSLVLWSWETVYVFTVWLNSWLVACFVVCCYVICISPCIPLTISYFVLCYTSSFWLRIWEIIDRTKPLRKFSLGNLLWTFFFFCWMISCFWLSDNLYTYSLFYTAFFNQPGVFITQSWLLMWVMYGNMQSKTEQIYVLVHIMALNEFQNSFGYMIINRLLSLCKLLGSESWRCDLGVENAVTSFFLNGFWYGSTSYTCDPNRVWGHLLHFTPPIYRQHTIRVWLKCFCFMCILWKSPDRKSPSGCWVWDGQWNQSCAFHFCACTFGKGSGSMLYF